MLNITLEVSISEALRRYEAFLEKEKPKSAKDIINLTTTALSRYTLPALKHPHPAPVSRKPTNEEKKALQEKLNNTSVTELLYAEAAQQQTFTKIGASPAQQYTYRSKLKAFITWCKSAGLLRQNKNSSTNFTPKFRHGYIPANRSRITNRKIQSNYTLKPEEISAKLDFELQDFFNFMTKSRFIGRRFAPLKKSVAEGHIVQIKRIFGWVLLSGAVSNANDLSLDTLVPKSLIKSAKSATDKAEALVQAEAAGMYVNEWLHSFLDFLETDRKVSPSGLVTGIIPINILVKFQHYKESNEKDFSDVPAMKVIREHLSELAQKAKGQKSTADKSLKWLDLEDVFTKIVIPLRLECAYKTIDGVPRTITAIASSFQRFLAYGFLTFIPPRRQQEWRGVKIATSCLLTDKPKNLLPGQFIHPLPANRDDEKDYGYLYKDMDGKWYKDTPAESYKTGKIYGHQKLEIPNKSFNEGEKCFYDYIEAFLYGYYRDLKGNWLSGGQLIGEEISFRSGSWHSLRSSFNPAHNFLFCKTQNGKPGDQHFFYNLVVHNAKRLTGQRLNPHLLRDIFATHFLSSDYTGGEIESLAHAMGHSVKELRKTYDERSQAQKSRPITNRMDQLVGDLMDGSPRAQPLKKKIKQEMSDRDFRKKVLAMLTPEQLAKLDS